METNKMEKYENRDKIKIDDLLLYETPWISEWVSIDWIQTIVARLLAWKINRKIVRYHNRLKRVEYLKKYFKRPLTSSPSEE